MELFEMTFGRIVSMFTESIYTTLYFFLCTIILCVLYQIFFLRKASKINRESLTVGHFVLVFVFLFYLMSVYRLTGISSIWDIASQGGVIHLGEISLIPFETFDFTIPLESSMTYVLNIIMMIPFGFLLPLIWTEFRTVNRVAIIGFIFSVVIEVNQLFSFRATTVDDLIMNTLGAIVGCLIYRWVYSIACKKDEVKTKEIILSPILRNEAIIYLICSFMGVFLLYNQTLLEDFNSKGDLQGRISINVVDENGEEYTSGTIKKVLENEIKINKTTTWALTDGSFSSETTKEELTISLSEDTIFEIWQTDEQGRNKPTIEEVSRDNIVSGDMVNIYFNDEKSYAKKIVVWRFDG